MANQTSAPADMKELTKCIRNINIGIMGDPGVGKSRLYKGLVGSQIDADKHKDALIWIDVELRITDSFENGLSLRIWDSPTFNECTLLIIPSLLCDYHTAYGIILVYDCTNQESFDNLNIWLDIIDQISAHTVPKLLVGNKSDLLDKKVVPYAIAKVDCK